MANSVREKKIYIHNFFVKVKCNFLRIVESSCPHRLDPPIVETSKQFDANLNVGLSGVFQNRKFEKIWYKYDTDRNGSLDIDETR